MATLTHSQSKRLYSWWWDSHISPKSSKWLEENLSDMDSKVKAMIKLIEVDADTFAKRAEMFYKKRPELLKLVEEFYRTYRALAEKYSSATGVLRQAHSTMVEVCPDHVPFELPDDSPGNSLETDDPHTPQVPIQSRASFYPNLLQKDGLEFSSPGFHSVSSGVYTEEKQFIDNVLGSEREVRKGLDFDSADEKDQTSTESAVAVKFEKDIQVLKDTLAKLDAEKAAGLANFQQSLERLSKLESEVCQAQEDSKRVDGQAKKAESEVEILRKALYKLEAEKNASFLHYQHSLERFSKLETVVSLAQAESKRVDEQTCKAYGEVQTLKEALYKLEAEKEFSFHGYQWSLERLSKLESDLYHAQEDYKRVDERAKSAEDEVETLKEALKKLEAEKEVSHLQYQQCLARIAHLESDSSHSQENAQELSERAHKAEAEAQSLKQFLSNLESEKDEIEKKLQIAQEDGRKHIERALTAEEQVETLNHALHKLTEEKEAAFFQYQQCLESISSLEEKLSTAQDEVQKVNGEVQRVVAKLYNVEERRLVLEELCESQNKKLTEKQKEMDVEKLEHSSLTQKNEQTIVLLEERCRSMKKEMDESSNYQLQMPVLQGYIRELLKILREQGQKEEALVNEKLNLEKVVVDLKKELEEVQMIRHEREMQILKLSENNHSLSMENEGFSELFGSCRSLKDGIFSGDSRVQLLQERISSLEGENKSLKCQSAVCAQAIIALKDSISSLEKSTSVQTRFQKTRDKGAKGEDASSRSSSESLKAMSPDQQGPDMVSEVKDLLRRLTAAEKVVIKIKKIAAKECIEANTKLESAIKLMEELKISRCSNPEESSESGSLMKDIVLDKVSQTLSRQIRRSQSEDTEYLLESWDTSLDRSIGLTVEKGKRKSVSARVEGHRRYSSKVGSIEELTGDKSDFSTTPSLPRQEANKRRILDRLNSDFLKLSNLRITVHDLTERVDRNKKNKNHDEWDTLKDQLEEAEESIQKLSDVQSKLKRSAEEKSAMAADESGAFRRRRIAEKAKRVSEKIGRLQLEVQKMQFLLLKLDDETDKGKKVKSRVVESKKKVLLRDYLYGSGGRSSFRKKKKAACCGFVQPSTKED